MNLTYKTFVYVVLVVSSYSANAQEESFPCKKANPELKNLFNGEALDFLYVHNCYGAGLHGMSSSYLKAGGTAPKIIEYEDEIPDDQAYVAWTCKYSMGNIGDDNPATTWVEGVEGYGIGEVLIVPCLDLNKPIKIWAGYGKSSNSFTSNSRPSVVRLVIIQAEVEGATQYGAIYKNLHVVSQSKVELRDINAYQSLDIPFFKPGTYKKDSQQWDYNYFLGLEIVEIYKGSKWDDTCISEIRNE